MFEGESPRGDTKCNTICTLIFAGFTFCGFHVGCWSLLCAYLLTSKFSQTKLLQMTANLWKPQTLNPVNSKGHTVCWTMIRTQTNKELKMRMQYIWSRCMGVGVRNKYKWETYTCLQHTDHTIVHAAGDHMHECKSNWSCLLPFFLRLCWNQSIHHCCLRYHLEHLTTCRYVAQTCRYTCMHACTHAHTHTTHTN